MKNSHLIFYANHVSQTQCVSTGFTVYIPLGIMQ
jgi:hypothetical protein